MAGGYARESAKPRDRRNSEDYDPVQEFHPDELKISKAHRKAANLRSFGDLAPSIDQPASRTLGSKVLYSNPSESGGNLLREEWDRPIYDPPTQDGYMNYKQATANTGYHHRGYEKRKAGMEAEEAVFYGWHHESLIEPAAQWRDAALNSARLREGHLGENRFRANRDRWSLRGHQEQINALYNSYKKGQEAYNMHLINSYPTGVSPASGVSFRRLTLLLASDERSTIFECVSACFQLLISYITAVLPHLCQLPGR